MYNQSKKLEDTLNEAIKEAVEKKIKTIEIIPGKGSGQLKKRVLRFLNQSHIKTQYHRIDKDSKNFGRLFVHFRH
ncbi:DNA mismatch repair protein MutS [bacterium]|nr:DNA mismatch repair protein MutS [bacterium]